MVRRLRIASVAYGEKYTGYLNKFMLQSIIMDVDRLRLEGWEVECNSYPDFMDMLRAEVQASREGAYTFFSGPDIIWAKGSLYRLARQIEHLDVAIAVPHFRVNDDFYLGPGAIPIDAPALAAMALAFAHSTFTESFDMLPENQCHWGISAREVDDNLITMRHCIPTVAMIKFRDSDLELFAYVERMGTVKPVTQWDRAFLNKLAGEKRLKIVGSSDMAFCVELTAREATNEKRANNFNDQHEYMRDEADFCRSTLYTIRRAG